MRSLMGSSLQLSKECGRGCASRKRLLCRWPHMLLDYTFTSTSLVLDTARILEGTGSFGAKIIVLGPVYLLSCEGPG